MCWTFNHQNKIEMTQSHIPFHKHAQVALSYLIFFRHLWGFDVYRSVALVDRSEYPTLMYGMDKWIIWMGWLGWLLYPSTTHMVVMAHLPESALADGPRPSNGQMWQCNGNVSQPNSCLSLVTIRGRSALGPRRSTLALKIILLNLSHSG
jgi:hypothetical protein